MSVNILTNLSHQQQKAEQTFPVRLPSYLANEAYSQNDRKSNAEDNCSFLLLFALLSYNISADEAGPAQGFVGPEQEILTAISAKVCCVSLSMLPNACLLENR